MRRLFSTDGAPDEDRFRAWRSFSNERLVPLDYVQLGEAPLRASVDGATIGGLVFTRFSLGCLRAAATPRTIRSESNKTDRLWINMMLSGSVHVDQLSHTTTDWTGDFSIRDTSVPWAIQYDGPVETLAVEIPRDRLESMLGSARHFAGLTVAGDLPTTILARSFLSELMRVGDRLTPDAAERMTSVGIDLVAASIAERMALETPKPLHGTLIVQRAKAYVEANLGNIDLDPPQVAAAVGVSLRHLHALFRERGRNVAAWIWHRRLELATRRLSDPACLHLSLGELAYGCGFANQAHFSHRFRDRHGMTPRDYRHNALSGASVRDTTR